MKIRIYYEDTDAGGVVYHSNYFKFCERARSESFLQNGIELFTQNCGFIMRKIFYADFFKPARLGDMVEVKTEISLIKKASFVVLHKIYKDDVLLFETEILAAYICNGKPTKIPKQTVEFLKTHYGAIE